MVALSDEVEAEILRIAEEMRKEGKPMPQTLRELPDFPFSTFESLREALLQRRTLIQKFSFNYDCNIFKIP